VSELSELEKSKETPKKVLSLVLVQPNGRYPEFKIIIVPVKA
jgi:hypothetical protein